MALATTIRMKCEPVWRSLFSEKMLISNRCISGLMPNMIKKSWTVSNIAIQPPLYVSRRSVPLVPISSGGPCMELGLSVNDILVFFFSFFVPLWWLNDLYVCWSYRSYLVTEKYFKSLRLQNNWSLFWWGSSFLLHFLLNFCTAKSLDVKGVNILLLPNVFY